MSISFYSVASKPDNESDREKAIARTGILAEPHQEKFHSILDCVRGALHARAAAITIVYQDSTYLVSALGFDAGIYKRSSSLCAHTILSPDSLTVVPDTAADERFAGNPYVDTIEGIRFYIAAPLLDENGAALGALCAFDQKAREVVTEEDRAMLWELKIKAEAIVNSIRGDGGEILKEALVAPTRVSEAER
jgi:GAF domain-containing protein